MEKEMLKRLARDLRNNATKQENQLWYRFLRHRPEQWYRQKRIDGFIVDFYCAKLKLVVELDGMHHLEPQQHAYDTERSAFLEAKGLTVLRFQNWEIDHNLLEVQKRIEEESLSRRESPSAKPSSLPAGD